jgi:hypothetical protein
MPSTTSLFHKAKTQFALLAFAAVLLSGCMFVGSATYPPEWPDRTLAVPSCASIDDLFAVHPEKVAPKDVDQSVGIWDIFDVDDAGVKENAKLVKLRLEDGHKPLLTFLTDEHKVIWSGESRFSMVCQDGILEFSAKETSQTEHSSSLIGGRLSFAQTVSGALAVHVAAHEFGTAFILVPIAAHMHAWLLFSNRS